MVLCLCLFLLLVALFILFMTSKNHYLSALILLESMVLTSLMLSIYVISNNVSNMWLFLLLLAFGVCEAGLGVSLLMTFVKITGSDFINPIPRR
uniref:NADH-ubiquinone oxidoreductase chain 4L n=1 Tax=Megalophaedusa albela TaxID=1885740 RepID=A0A224AB90_9EUPU|nr:NADH dehydrogenase subunit 4L [Megalophaedusa albela]